MLRIKTRRIVALRYVAMRYASSCVTLLICLFAWSPALLGDWRDDAGYTKLINLLGADVPNGAGVPISLVEASTGGNNRYFPNTEHSQFDALSDPDGIAVSFTDGSGGQSNGTSDHSNAQGQTFFGNTTSVAPAANAVTVYEANDYLNDILNLNGSNTAPPDSINFRVQNFSWIGTFVTIQKIHHHLS